MGAGWRTRVGEKRGGATGREEARRRKERGRKRLASLEKGTTPERLRAGGGGKNRMEAAARGERESEVGAGRRIAVGPPARRTSCEGRARVSQALISLSLKKGANPPQIGFN